MIDANNREWNETNSSQYTKSFIRAWWLVECSKTHGWVMLMPDSRYWILPMPARLEYHTTDEGAIGPFPTLESAQAAYLVSS